jgi:hypothetical protein
MGAPQTPIPFEAFINVFTSNYKEKHTLRMMPRWVPEAELQLASRA